VTATAPAPGDQLLDRLLVDLNPAQRQAVSAVEGPLAILAGAGSGKTRVISRRTAYAIASGIVPADQVLVVTFTDKAAGEMVERLASLGLRGVTARTFHSHALTQLRHFWPARNEGRPLPEILDSKLPILGRLARQLPGAYRFVPARDLADEIEWAKSRRIPPERFEREARDLTSPLPADLMARVYADYERAKDRANRIDFDDMLTRTVDLLETDAAAARTVRARKRWFCVDEYQDTNPLQQRLLELWAGDHDDVCVVGDEDQTIYTFTGATSAYLTGFADRHPGARVVDLAENYRSTPEVLEVANRLLAGDPTPGRRVKRLVATRPSGPAPTVMPYPTAEAELAGLIVRVRALIAEGVAPAEIAVLVRMNAQIAPIEDALTRAGIGYRVRGAGFYARPEVRAAIEALRRPSIEATGSALPRAVRDRWREAFGFGADDDAAEGREARERDAALETLLAILDELRRTTPGADARGYLAELAARAAHERTSAADGVNLLTYHRAKGLEWDAVVLPMLEEGSLPIHGSQNDPTELAEERRLLYVGVTRARIHLTLSWAARRETRGRDAKRVPSRFLDDLAPRPARTVTQLPDRFSGPRAADPADAVFAALRSWRSERARAEGVPAYVIAHDQTLVAIADAAPKTLPGLRRVKGMGPARVDRYGGEILAVLARAVSERDPSPRP
jgi:DNA helicase II / ATP-dependent DNA helicase PcrA